MLFDTHAHLDSHQFDDDRAALIDALPGAGLGLVLNPGCDLASSRIAVALAERYDFIYAAVGTHPSDIGELNDDILEQYRALCKTHPKIRAIGEIGLDYHWNHFPKEVQQKGFRDQMALARELGLPVIIHDREAHQDCLNIVREFPDVTGVFHCFSGSAEMAKEVVKLGYYVGFTGVVTYKNARQPLEAAAAVPLDRLVIETDCPYLTPVPFRGQRNDPSRVLYTAEKLAELRGLTLEEFRRITMENGRRLYRID